MNFACREHGTAWLGQVLALRSMLVLTTVIALLLWGGANCVLGQGTGASAQIEEREPAILYLPITDGAISENGPLERVLDFPAASFRAWYDEIYLNRNPTELPKYSFEGIEADIEIQSLGAEVQVTYTVVPHAAGWIRIPLGLRNAIFRSDVQVSPAVPWRLHRPLPGQEADGYYVWCEIPAREETPLSPQAETPLTISVKALVPLTIRGDETSLETSLPDNTKCLVNLDIPQGSAVVSHFASVVLVSEETTFERTTQQFEFAEGDLALSWRFDEEAMQVQRPDLQIVGDIVASVDVEDSITTVATLEVESLTTEFSSFEVEIDDEAEFVPQANPPSGYSIRRLDNFGRPFGNRLLVELIEPTKGPVSITIETRQSDPVPSDRGKRQFTLGRFHVVGSKFQEGTLSITSAGNVHVTWDSPRLMREQSTRGSDDSNQRAAFRYRQQPATLKVYTLPIQATARVKSDYQLHVGKADSQLVAKFVYTLPRSYRDDLIVDLNGWEIESVDTQNAAQWQAMAAETDQLILPLGQEAGGEAIAARPYRTIEVTIEARHGHEHDDSDHVVLPWMVPQADPLGTATVIAIPDNDIEIRFVSEESSGFQLDRSRSQEAELKGSRGSIFLRAPSALDSLQLGLRLIPVVPRLIVSDAVSITLESGRPQALVEQQIEFEPLHSMQESIRVRLPQAVNRFDLMDAQINGRKVIGQEVAESLEPAMDYPLSEVSPPYRLQLKYAVPLQVMQDDAGEYQLDLVAPLTEHLTAQGIEVGHKPQTVTFAAPQQVEVLSETETWQSFAPQGSQQTVHLPPERSGSVRIAAPFLAPQEDRRVVIDFHWLQVGLTPDRRRDRAVFLLRTTTPKIELELPAGVDNVSLYWNGVETSYTRLDDDRIAFDLPEGATVQASRLELWYDYPAGITTSLAVTSPRISQAVLGSAQAGGEGGYSYLQIVTPGNWLVLSASSLSEEMNWVWDRGRYQRVPRLTQEQLERMAATNAPSRLPRGMNRYLYSTIGPISHVEVTAVKSSHLMLLFSGATLAILLTLFYVPQTRHVLVVASVGIVGMGLVLAYPDFAVLAGEMSALGAMLAVLGIVLYRIASYRVPVRSAVRARSSDSHAALTTPPKAAAPTPPNVAPASTAAISSGGNAR